MVWYGMVWCGMIRYGIIWIGNGMQIATRLNRIIPQHTTKPNMSVVWRVSAWLDIASKCTFVELADVGGTWSCYEHFVANLLKVVGAPRPLRRIANCFTMLCAGEPGNVGRGGGIGFFLARQMLFGGNCFQGCEDSLKLGESMPNKMFD